MGVSLRVILIRHTHAYDRKAWHGNDWERPLSPKGERHAKQVGKVLSSMLRRNKDVLEVCYASEAIRSYMTARKILKYFPDTCCVRTPLINPDAGISGYINLINEAQEEGNTMIAIVGHEYDLSKTLGHLCGIRHIRWKKGGYFILDLKDGKWYLNAL